MKAKDSLASRVGRIISGSAKKVVEILESAAPEMVMEEAIDEIDNAILDVREELGRVEAEKHMANKRLTDVTAKHEELSFQIRIALDEKREDLAEAAVQRQLDIESQMPVLESTINEANDKINELNSYISALQAKKREMRDDLKEWRSSKAIAETIAAGGAAKSGADIDAKVARAEAAFERILDKKAVAGAFDSKNAAKLAELEQLTRENRVKERLSQIKAKRNEDNND